MSGLERLYSPPEIGAPGKRKARTMRRDLTLAGLLVLGMAALAVATFMYLGSWLFGNVYHLRAYFANASGLHTSTQVIQDGYVIGAVERMTAIIPGRHEGVENCPPRRRTRRKSRSRKGKAHPSLPAFG